MRIVVLVPSSATTGGVELLYQFVDIANTVGVSAYVCHYPFSTQVNIPEVYSRYNCRTLTRSEVRRKDIIVLPEIYTYLSDEFSENPTYLWWLSVDNYYGSNTPRYQFANRFLPWRFKSIDSPSFSDLFEGHLCQSQYSADHLLQHGIKCDFFVSDYINQIFVRDIISVCDNNRKDLVVFNPAKGFEQTSKIMSLSRFEFRPIKNMSRAQIIELLKSAKLYIDFGNHPGKDRIPREAAAMGCIVITNRRGSALNDQDIPIPPNLKIDDSTAGFAEYAARRIEDVISNYSDYHAQLASYRNVIANEKSNFSLAVQNFACALQNKYDLSPIT